MVGGGGGGDSGCTDSGWCGWWSDVAAVGTVVADRQGRVLGGVATVIAAFVLSAEFVCCYHSSPRSN